MHFQTDDFMQQLKESELAQGANSDKTAADLAELYQCVISGILDELAPMSETMTRVRPQGPHYDGECRQARRVARRAERVYRRLKGTNKEAAARSDWRAALKFKRKLVKWKGQQYWSRSLESAGSDTAKSWKCLNTLLGEGGPDPGSRPYFDAEDYHQYIDGKVEGIRNQIATAGTATYTQYHGPLPVEYLAPTVDEITALVKASPNKSCPADPMPMWPVPD